MPGFCVTCVFVVHACLTAVKVLNTAGHSKSLDLVPAAAAGVFDAFLMLL